MPRVIDEKTIKKLRLQNKMSQDDFFSSDEDARLAENVVKSLDQIVSKVAENTNVKDALLILQSSWQKSIEKMAEDKGPKRYELVMPEKYRPPKWIFRIKRDERGFIEEIYAETQE
jgi:hypothetical protein